MIIVATYNTCSSIPARIWLAVIDVDLTAVALKPSGTLTSVCVNKVLKNSIESLYGLKLISLFVHKVSFNLRCKFLDFDKGLANIHWFHSDSLFPRSLEHRNRSTHHGHHLYKQLHFGMATVAHREADLITMIHGRVHGLSFQFLPTSQRLPEYPDRQIHSFGTLQYPPTEAA